MTTDFDLASMIRRTAQSEAITPAATFVGIVSTTSPLRVDTGGVTVSAQRLSSYTPTTNDQVLVARVGNRFVILGKVI